MDVSPCSKDHNCEGQLGRYTAYPIVALQSSRIDVHGWVDGIVAPTNGDFSPNLWFPGQDSRQAYTDEFGGTSGASAQTAAAAAVRSRLVAEAHAALGAVVGGGLRGLAAAAPPHRLGQEP